MGLSLAISPCPNDTFVFSAWVHGQVPGPEVDVTFADIDVCNQNARSFDVAKVSFAALPDLLDDYALLPCGGALGHGVGPLVVARSEDQSLEGATVAVPGERTTAYLLLRLWRKGFRVVVMPFDQIMPAVRGGAVDVGLVIHESRFTYPSYGLVSLQDLGAWWETETGLPIPLGAIMARRSLDTQALTSTIRASVEHAWADPAASAGFVAAHSLEMSPEVCQQHIALYVNEFTGDLGDAGYAAVEALLSRAATEGLVPPLRRPLR
ncbi:MAG: 1,4-dihydroxy-6-naphthoate synthase [Actinomycetota bacterium]|nr:1,4-dihydroxy-6-naphthoate synthase [Actinomycetota bacterium]